ncbi:unnamed protein product [Ceratitis capitata]|uniref:(Mediterranean fruit fly) hypothetical protein n=1 Tax=Ceratitis capitata TaxID=7213 RepID=A0A811USE0_CERCA|nr:unnamed protein product [Ceratitis capitata]
MRAVLLKMAHDLKAAKNFVGVDNEAKRFTELFDWELIQCIDRLLSSPFNPDKGDAWEKTSQCLKTTINAEYFSAGNRQYREKMSSVSDIPTSTSAVRQQ